MTTPNTVDYPAALLAANWDSNKGTIARMAGETGIGAALRKLKEKHGAIDWSQVTAGGYGKLHDIAEVDQAEQKAKAYYQSKVVPYLTEARAVRDLALGVARKFSDNPLIPKSSTAYVASIAKSADIVSVACKSLDEEFKTFGAKREQLSRQIEEQKKLIRPNIEKLKAGLADCIRKPTKPQWDQSVKQQCRSICNGIRVNPEWRAKFWDTWQNYDGESFYNKLKDEAKLDDSGRRKQADDVVHMCKQIQDKLRELESYFS